MDTKPAWSNCVVSAIYLCLRGNVKAVYLVRAKHRCVPAHIVIENNKGNVLHFRPIMLEREGTHQNPIYFNGYFEGIKRSRLKELQKDRPFLLKLNVVEYLFLAFLLFFVLFIPWILFWPCQYIFFRMIPDVVCLVKRRCLRLGNYLTRNFLGL